MEIKKSRVAMMTEVQKFEIQEYDIPEVGDKRNVDPCRRMWCMWYRCARVQIRSDELSSDSIGA